MVFGLQIVFGDKHSYAALPLYLGLAMTVDIDRRVTGSGGPGTVRVWT